MNLLWAFRRREEGLRVSASIRFCYRLGDERLRTGDSPLWGTGAQRKINFAMAREPRFLSGGLIRPLGTLLYDFFSFTTFLLYFPICLIVGGPAYLLDRTLGTRCLDRLIRILELFAR